jgi:hypothetical protein
MMHVHIIVEDASALIRKAMTKAHARIPRHR